MIKRINNTYEIESKVSYVGVRITRFRLLNEVDAMNVDLNGIDWQRLVMMLEHKIRGRKLADRVGVTTQAVGHWRRGIQQPSLNSAVVIFSLVSEHYMTDTERSGSVDDYFNRLNDLLPRGCVYESTLRAG